MVALLTVSCNDWLKVVPKTMSPADAMFESYQGYKDALAGCYVKMKDRSLWGEHMTITSVEFLAQHWQFGNFTVASTVTEGTAIKKYDYDDDNVKAVFQNIYNGLYNIIVQANAIIEAMPETGATAIPDPQARGVVEGEARAIRAMCHFEILRLFGQVPGGGLPAISLPYITAVSREPVVYLDYDRFVEKIANDLDRAAELLAEHDPYVEYTYAEVNGLGNGVSPVADEFLRYRVLRLNYWAVRALQARFHLYVGNRAEASKAADEVIAASVAGKGFSMESNAAELNVSNGNAYYALPGEGLFMLSNYQLADYNPQLFCTSGAIMELRLYMSAARMEGTAGVFGLFDEPHAASNNNRFRGQWRQRSHPQWDDPTIYELLKYDQEQTGGGSLYQLVRKQVMPMLRLSEMYLIAMETGSDMSRINELYNTYRTARNIVGTEFTDRQDVMAMIEREYRREFFGEGQMFFYYKRNNSKSMVWAADPITEANYRIPLPATEYQLKER
jgi:hypothetical protein